MDLTGMDVCDKVQQFGLQKEIAQLKNCRVERKVVPLLPNGKHPGLIDLPYYEKQKKVKENRL